MRKPLQAGDGLQGKFRQRWYGVTTICVAKDDTGKLVGLTDQDHRAWRRFTKMTDGLGCGEFFSIDYWFPRNPALHKLHFKIVGTLFDAQETFENVDQLRAWLYVGAGYCDVVPDGKGGVVAIPKSIKWSKIDDAEFESKVHRPMLDFIRGEHARGFLWPRLTPTETYDIVDILLSQFGSE